MKTTRTWVRVAWTEAKAEPVPIVPVAGLGVLGADRLLRFERQRSPWSARHSPNKDRKRVAAPVEVL